MLNVWLATVTISLVIYKLTEFSSTEIHMAILRRLKIFLPDRRKDIVNKVLKRSRVYHQ